ncbi:MAG TPA: site-specific integrase [Xanthobacteraceae bacterium]|nr:site-specific integrase [Xanthobacteraceae bacterium]
MGTIIGRTRKDGSRAFLAQITIKKAGVIVHRESETFDRKPAANAWIVKREAELKRPGGLDHKEDPALSSVIDRYIAESRNPVLGTKAQVLKAIKNSDLGDTKCSEITSNKLVSFARDLNNEVEPQTCGNYFSHLSNIFTVARPAWGYPLSRQEFDDAVTVIKKLGLIRKGNERNRRPSLEELDLLMEHFGRVRDNRPSSIPMQTIVAFALFSTRRQEEITLLRWEDLDGDRILVRDMKHPGDKKGNNVYCELPPEALAAINSMPRDGERIFPYSTDAISAAFTRACKILGIEDLRFHDLRHEGISRLFEIGRTIPQVAAVSGHRSWNSLKRYTHIRQSKDKYQNWKWADLFTVG